LVALVVNDDEATRYVTKKILTGAGYRVVEAETGGEGLARARDGADVIVLDVKLPDIDGFEVCRRLKADPATAFIPVLQTSAAYITAESRAQGLDSGADGYLVQPFEDIELVATLAALLRARRAEAELRAHAAALAEADRRKDEFLAMLAHELRNPLSAIGAALAVQEALARGDETSVRVQETLTRQTRHLARLVDDLLDVSRITHGKIELRRRVVDLVEVTRRALAAAEPLMESRGTRLEVTLPKAPLPVDVDVLRIEQVIVNLLGNAAKFSPAGGAVEVSLEGENDPPRAVLRVRDHGIGIDPASLESIFDMFVQVDQSAARSRGGLGIGLTMVKKLVFLHGGEVHADSEGEGRGATFTVRLPLAAAVSTGAEVIEAARPTSRRQRILLIEDNVDITDFIRIQLEMWGHDVSVAHDGPSGLEAALSLRPDIALVDVGLPGMDGYELARRIRTDTAGLEIRLVAMTGYGRPEDRARSLAAGFDAHLVKPVDPRQLQALLDSETVARS
jgi:signal transduction histidine kinase